MNIYIGFDPKESISFHVCANSIIRHSSMPVSIKPLALTMLRDYKESHLDGSTEFTYTRFLVPYLNNFKDWAIYIDSDIILKEDILKILDFRNEDNAVSVVKHNYNTSTVNKFLNNVNNHYPRKNWSSVMLWNCSHNSNKRLNPKFIEEASGEFLHRFKWLEDNDIGDIPPEWNWLVDEYGENLNAKLLHWTLGTPCFKEYSNSPQASEWIDEYKLTIKPFGEIGS